MWLPEAEKESSVHTSSFQIIEMTVPFCEYATHAELHIGKHTRVNSMTYEWQKHLKQNALKISWGMLLQNQSYFCVVLGTEPRALHI